MRDARALTWRLGMVHRGLATPAMLDTYALERTGHVLEIIDEAVALGRVICELDVDRAPARDAEMKKQARDPDAATREPPHPRLGKPSPTIASFLRQGLNWSWQRPARRATERNDDAIQLWVKKRWPQLKKGHGARTR